MNSTQNLPARLKELRKKNHYSQEYVAEQLNISRQAISHWENGKSYPDIDNLVLLAELYNVSVDELLHDEQSKETMDNSSHNSQMDTAKIVEQIGYAIVLILSTNLPFLGIPVALLITAWLIHNKRHYKLIYLLCAICVVVAMHEFLAVYAHINNFYGDTIFIPVE